MDVYPILAKCKVKLVAFAFLVPLLFGSVAWAQGDDFPPIGGTPSDGGGPGITPPGGNGSRNWHTGWAVPMFPLQALKGDKVVLNFRTTGWGVGNLWTQFQCTGCANVYNSGQQYGVGKLEQWYWPFGEFCFSCTIIFDVTEDFPFVGVTYGADVWFRLQLDLIEIIPGPGKPKFSILPDWSKQTYHSIAGWLTVGSVLSASGAAYACTSFSILDPLACVALNGATQLTALAAGLLSLVDPWDDGYGWAYDPVYPSADELGMAYMGSGYGDWRDDIVEANNRLIDHAIAYVALMRAAYVSTNRANSCFEIDAGCQDWQAERARQFYEAANERAYAMAVAFSDLSYIAEQNGQGDAPYLEAWRTAEGAFWQQSQNGVR